MMRNKLTYKLFLFVLTAFISLTVFGQAKIVTKKLELTKIPKGIKYEGQIKTAVSWVDSLGYNIAILTETGIYESKKFKHENDSGDAELFAYHFIVKNHSAVQTWKVYDFISDCPVDIEAKFIRNSFQVTDLNKDGVGEIWVMYKTICHGDVSPCDMKIIMYQGQQKFAIRGQNKVFQGTDDDGTKHYGGGDYKYDKTFADGPKEFLEFAKKLWDNNIMQTLEE
ncbi:hypothetical protein EZJ43_10700 [Pedobacter changchengzhani]|uniref:Uncharacterized protein n=1 Tax=Pedobacter changchengzhani TaxID=2529274 RepID=A0A4R5ML53_9SPHI|nr:hypothetical protein [Pedobacter changchengzhani]TDG35819.1 hypothetical protein EZJ43_10700 [Pedobacter changchengzhani]